MTSNRLIALLLVGIMALSVFAGGAVMAASTTVDSDLDDTETTEEEITENIVTNFNADEEQSTLIQVETTTTTDTEEDFEELSINISYDGVEHFAMDLSDIDDADFDAGTDDTDPATVDFHVDHDELETLPGEPGESTIVDVYVTEVEDAEDGVDETSEFVADFEFGDERAVVYMAEDTSTFDDDLDSEEPAESIIPFMGADEDDPDKFALGTDLNVAEDTNVEIYTADAEDGYEDAVGPFDTDEAPVLGQTVVMDDEIVPVYYGEAADFQDEDAAYGVYDDGHLNISNANEIAGADEGETAEVSMEYASANALDEMVNFDATLSDVTDAYDDELTGADIRDGFGTTTWLLSIVGLAFTGFFAGGLLVVTPRRRATEA